MIEYEQDRELKTVFEDVYAEDQFKQLRAHKIKVLPLLKINLDAKEQPKPCRGRGAVCKKLGLAEQMLIDGTHYLLIVDSGKWNSLGKDQRVVLLFNALMGVGVDTSGKKIWPAGKK